VRVYLCHKWHYLLKIRRLLSPRYALFDGRLSNYQEKKCRLWYLRWGILAAKLVDDVIAVVFRVEALLLKQLHNGREFPQVRDGWWGRFRKAMNL
jgi:hypothetical protein